MTSYLIFPDHASCLARTHAEAVSRGCDPNGDTQYWWAQIAHPTNGQWALVIPDGDVAGLTTSEQIAIVSTATMIAGGWVVA